MVSFKKLRDGSWGVIGDSNLLRPGARVTVKKKGGGESIVVVDRVLWSGDGKAIVKITPSRVHKNSRSSGREMCQNCFERPATTTATDNSGITGAVCGVCARDRFGLSFA